MANTIAIHHRSPNLEAQLSLVKMQISATSNRMSILIDRMGEHASNEHAHLFDIAEQSYFEACDQWDELWVKRSKLEQRIDPFKFDDIPF